MLFFFLYFAIVTGIFSDTTAFPVLVYTSSVNAVNTVATVFTCCYDLCFLFTGRGDHTLLLTLLFITSVAAAVAAT